MADLNPFKNPIKKLKKFIEHGPLEALGKEPTGIVKGVVDSAKEDLIKQATKDMIRQIYMPSSEKNEHGGHNGPIEMQAGEEHDLSGTHKENTEHNEKSEFADADPGINYRREILHYRESINSSEHGELRQQVNEVMLELRRLADSTTAVTAELHAVAVSSTPAEVGKYHVNFFEWMLVTLKQARMKIEDSGAWLGAMSSKKGKKDYWSQFKKHGTSFGMSNERGVATQTG